MRALNEKELTEAIINFNKGFKKTDQYERFDIENTEVIIELKCRRKHYDDLMIEKSKYDALVKEANESNRVPYYVVSTPNGVWLFNLNNEPAWVTRVLPSHTDFKSRYIEKEVGFLFINEGIDVTDKFKTNDDETTF